MVKVISKARKLIINLAESAWWQGILFSKGRSYMDTPGKFIERLTPEERKTLKQLTSGEISDVLYPPI